MHSSQSGSGQNEDTSVKNSLGIYNFAPQCIDSYHKNQVKSNFRLHGCVL